jgi:murein L,D-transpeptidase YafK
VLVISVLLYASLSAQSFKQLQLKNNRVKTAYQKHWSGLKKEINQLKIDTTNFFVYLRAFKQEGQLEIWLRSKKEKTYALFKVFPICSSSGELGPKKKKEMAKCLKVSIQSLLLILTAAIIYPLKLTIQIKQMFI